ncbi:MAG: hypothetical protein OEV30_05070 [Ignavibacteria bacterium]|nr:hypothetical protein [Ignavibacteria bacterium]
MMTTVILLLAFLLPQQQEKLTVRFIGNEAFEISDGISTILTDYPYGCESCWIPVQDETRTFGEN